MTKMMTHFSVPGVVTLYIVCHNFKFKGHPITCCNWHRGGAEVQIYSCLSSALDGVGGQRYAPARSEREGKTSPTPAFEPRTIQSVAKNYFIHTVQ
jgi:hypothetical protein